jgi:hypothetical protein
VRIMRRSLTVIAVVLLSFLLGLAVGKLKRRPDPTSPVNTASRPASDTNDGKPRVDFAEVFRGFDFAGSRVVHAEDDACPFGEKDARPLPGEVEEGRAYVFHRQDSADRDPQFGALQERIESLGIETSVSGHTITGNRLHPEILLFQGKGYVGNVMGHAHRTVSNSGEQSLSSEVSDYVLTLVKVP